MTSDEEYQEIRRVLRELVIAILQDMKGDCVLSSYAMTRLAAARALLKELDGDSFPTGFSIEDMA
jgi:hypothetical protein